MAIFAFGTIFFWLLLVLTVILMTAFVEKEEQTGTGATITFLVSMALMCFLGNLETFKSLLNYVTENPGTIIGLGLLYIVLSVAWSFFKWYFYLSAIKEYHKQRTFDIRKDDINISSSENKTRVLVWMSYWPLSATWTIINDPIRKMYKHILYRLSGFYQGISDRMFPELNEKTPKK